MPWLVTLHIPYVGIVSHRLHVYYIRWPHLKDSVGRSALKPAYRLFLRLSGLLSPLLIVLLILLEHGVDSPDLVELAAQMPVAVAHVCADKQENRCHGDVVEILEEIDEGESLVVYPCPVRAVIEEIAGVADKDCCEDRYVYDVMDKGVAVDCGKGKMGVHRHTQHIG